MVILEYVERVLSIMLKNKRGNDNKLFTRGPAFANFPNPTIKITSEDCGESGAQLKPKYSQFSASTTPVSNFSRYFVSMFKKLWHKYGLP